MRINGRYSRSRRKGKIWFMIVVAIEWRVSSRYTVEAKTEGKIIKLKIF